MKIGILGTRGIPNFYGGFEQFAEFFSVYLAEQGHEVYCYNSHTHEFKKKIFKGVNLIHCFDPENAVGTFGQFIYDFNCIIDSRKRNYDILLLLGYTSSAIWNKLLPKNTIIISNMDGLEWKRSKYSKLAKRFLKYSEKLAVKSSDFLISDSIGIQKYLFKEYNVDSKYIAYGAELFDNPDLKVLTQYNLQPYSYNMLIARFEPENNLETILDGVVLAKKKIPFLVVGRYDTNRFGSYLKNKFKDFDQILFLGGIYNLNDLNNLRYYSNLYFHGHSVGGTNPSLLEAMASRTLIIAHNNEFNNSILQDAAFYFSNKEDVKSYVEVAKKNNHMDKVEECFNKILNNYRWETINKMYLDYFNKCVR